METVWPETFAEFEGMVGVAVDWPKHAEQESCYLKGFTRGALAALKKQQNERIERAGRPGFFVSAIRSKRHFDGFAPVSPLFLPDETQERRGFQRFSPNSPISCGEESQRRRQIKAVPLVPSQKTKLKGESH